MAALEAVSTSAGDYSAGDLLGGKYRVQEVIGRGSSGVTYRVRLSTPSFNP